MLNEDDIILGTVERITSTTIFVKLENNQEGTIILSEIAPGRIKNLRAYVVPNKKIVCKVLRISGSHIDLSLRRVKSKEKKQVLEKYKQEKTAKSALRSILKEDAKSTEEKILKNFESVFDFMSQSKEDSNLIEKYIPKKFQEQIKKISKKKSKELEIKKEIKLKCLQNNGLSTIKQIMNIKNPNLKIIYITAGKFQLTLKGKQYKEINKQLEEILNQAQEKAKKQNCEFEVVDKK
jgi:translation initiation factor 2 alpha subunit (eIF-2alpha)